MKRILCFYLTIAVICALFGCGGETVRPVSFPLTDDEVLAAVGQMKLSWELSPDESQAYSENQRSHVLRDADRTYPGGEGNPLRAIVSSGNAAGGDYLLISFEGTVQTEKPEPDWDCWQKQLRLTELLWSMDEGRLTAALSKKTGPDRIITQNLETMGAVDNLVWELSLDNGERCDVRWHCYPCDFSSSAQTGRAVNKWAQRLSVRIYASDKVYDYFAALSGKTTEKPAAE